MAKKQKITRKVRALMSIFKRGSVYWYHFYFNGQHIQESTKQGNPNLARAIEASHRTRW